MHDENTSGQSTPHIEAELATAKSSEKLSIDINKLFLPLAILIAAVLISGTILYTNGGFKKSVGGIGNNQGEQRVEVSADDDMALGDANAPVTVIEFSDFQCPFCRRFWTDTLPQLKSQYIDTGKVRFVYRDFPLSIHPGAQPAAEAVECAREQGKEWQMHDKIFEEQNKKGSGTIQFGVAELKQWASQIGLNVTAFNSCLDGRKYKEEVERDFNDGTTAGVNGTPTFYINGQVLIGAQQLEAFKVLIDGELN